MTLVAAEVKTIPPLNLILNPVPNHQIQVQVAPVHIHADQKAINHHQLQIRIQVA